jgi:hypothetical protein
MNRKRVTRRMVLAGLGSAVSSAIACESSETTTGATGNASGGGGLGAGSSGSAGGGTGGATTGSGGAAPDGGVMSPWPEQTGDYLSALPGHTGYGMDNYGGGGRHPTNPTPNATIVLFVDTLAAGNTGRVSTDRSGNAIGFGTFEWAFRYNPGTDRSKFIVPLVGGIIRNITPASRTPYVTYCGQAAPGAGLFLHGTKPAISPLEGEPPYGDVQIWHLRSYMGDELNGIDGEDRDAFMIQRLTSFCAINCEFAWSTDEIIDNYYGGDLHTWLYCTFTDPLHVPPDLPHPDDPPGTDHGFGPIIGGGEDLVRGCFSRCLFAHATGRNPALYSVQKAAVVNCLLYNHGHEAIVVSQRTPTPKLLNAVANMYVRGPDGPEDLRGVRESGAAMDAASHGFTDGNVAHGWTYPNQAWFIDEGGFPSSYRVDALIAEAWPKGWDAHYPLAQDLTAPSAEEKLRFVEMMETSVGAQPGARVPGIGRIATIFAQCKDALVALDSTTQWANTVEEAGGWFEVPETTIADPFAPGDDWHAPIPSGPDRDTPLTSGTFSNGRSKAGYTRLEAWALELHWFKGGR